jgi:hypothetical protein
MAWLAQPFDVQRFGIVVMMRLRLTLNSATLTLGWANQGAAVDPHCDDQSRAPLVGIPRLCADVLFSMRAWIPGVQFAGLLAGALTAIFAASSFPVTAIGFVARLAVRL